MSAPVIDHDAIREAQDRSWTSRLLAALPTASPEDRDQIADTLEQLADPRAVAPLTAILEDRAADPELREAAASALRGQGETADGPTRRAWWAQGDEVLQSHALLCMDRAEADIVAPVAADPAHPHHRDAIATMLFGFEEPRFQALKVAALDHPDPDVRATAADVLLWDEPLAAHQPLVRCGDDPVDEVAVTALETLRYYPARSTARVLARIAADPGRTEPVRAMAAESLADLVDAVRDAVRDAGPASGLRAWLAPIADLVDLTEPEVAPPPHTPPRAEPRAPPPADELMACLGDPDGPWAERLARIPGPSAAPAYASDRVRLVPFLAGHPDPQVRERAAGLLAALGEAGPLLSLLGDPSFGVRKSAMYRLGQVRPVRAEVAAVAWAHLHEPGTTSTHAAETLATWGAHAPRPEAVAGAAALARDDPRETVRVHAVDHLRRLGATAEIRALLPLLQGPPAVTWALHLALLDAARDLGLPPPGLARLADVDDLHVQAAICRFA